MASDDITQPIEIATGRRVPFVGLSSPKPEADAPVPRETSSSTLIRQNVENILEIARAEKPSQEQLNRLHVDVSALAMLADKGLQVLGVPQGTGGRGGNLGAVLVASILSVGIALGVPGLTSKDDAAEAKVIAQTLSDSLTPRIAAIETKHTEAEVDRSDKERRSRRVDALTIRWLADQQQAQCKSLKIIAEGIAALAKGDKTHVPIECDQSSMPPELLALVAQSRIDESE